MSTAPFLGSSGVCQEVWIPPLHVPDEDPAARPYGVLDDAGHQLGVRPVYGGTPKRQEFLACFAASVSVSSAHAKLKKPNAHALTKRIACERRPHENSTANQRADEHASRPTGRSRMGIGHIDHRSITSPADTGAT